MLGAAKLAQGGVIVTIQTFTSNSSWVAPSTLLGAEVLLVGGGGGGGMGSNSSTYPGGGVGGAGGYIYTTLGNLVPGSTYTITVGTGGAGSIFNALGSTPATNGANTSITGTGISNLLARGGGAGGTITALPNGAIGGSGGGGATENTSVTTAGSAGIVGQGYAGGTATKAGTVAHGGGGGGAASIANSNLINSGGLNRSGGNPKYNTITGANVAYAEGGGGSGYSTGTTFPAGYYDGYRSTAAGSGGGAGTYTTTPADAGQAGIVVIKYTTSQ